MAEWHSIPRMFSIFLPFDWCARNRDTSRNTSRPILLKSEMRQWQNIPRKRKRLNRCRGGVEKPSLSIWLASSKLGIYDKYSYMRVQVNTVTLCSIMHCWQPDGWHTVGNYMIDASRRDIFCSERPVVRGPTLVTVLTELGVVVLKRIAQIWWWVGKLHRKVRMKVECIFALHLCRAIYSPNFAEEYARNFMPQQW